MSEEQAVEVETPAEQAVESAGVETTIPEVKRLFAYSRYVHLGEGAEECEGREDGRCRDTAHFHAWVRLPNQFQHETIVAKARAARARALRSLHDPASDSYVVLDSDMEELAKTQDREAIIEALTTVDELQDRLDAMGYVEDSDPEKWGTRTQDVYRRRELELEDPELRDQEEFDELTRSAQEYVAAVEARLEEIHGPRRAALEALDTDALVARVREQRIQVEANNAFSNAYTRYEWYVCTLKPLLHGTPQERHFKDMAALDGAAPEELDALRFTFNDLETAMRQGPAGNS